MCYKVKLKYTLYQEQYNAPTPTHPIQIGLDPFLQEVYQKFAAHKIFVYYSMPTNYSDNKTITSLSSLQL